MGDALLSVALYIVVPVIIAQVLRSRTLRSGGTRRLTSFSAARSPPPVALLTTLVLLFGFQGEQIIDQPLVIALLAVPILIQGYFNSGLCYLLNRAVGEAHCIAVASAFDWCQQLLRTGSSCRHKSFRVQVRRGARHCRGCVIEVPVMLSVVKIVNGTRGWYDSGHAVQKAGLLLRRIEV